MTRKWSSKTYGQVAMETQGNATAKFVELVKSAFAEKEKVENAERLKERGTLDKQNPHYTDAGKCERAVGLSLMNVPKTNPPDYRSRMNFLYGHAAEEAWTEVFELAGLKTYREIHSVMHYGDEKVSGRTDFIVVDETDHALIELKTTSSLSMKLTLEGMKRGEPQVFHDGYLKQLNLYLEASKNAALFHDDKAFPRFTHGYLLYLVKDVKKGQEPIQAFRQDYDAEMAESDLKRLAEIAQRARAGQVKDIPTEFTDFFKAKGRKHFRCGYCDFSDFCWTKELMDSLSGRAA